ncbi:MAG: tripartite tricarboxylate transporter substrate binding protein [Burkholderiaceae bacterium]|nr:tripartite tricarboxylate transporter substrate binding protein [Burkholderiaceae bacterium]
MRTTFRTALATIALGLVLSTGAHAQDGYPSRAIHWIVPYLPGTSPDNTVRVVAEAMARSLGQPVVVENKPGVAGNLGAQAAARAAPDGYTWVYSGSPMAASMRMYRKPGFDAMKDFVHVGRIGSSDLTVVTSPGSGIASMAQLVERARKQPGALMYASGGIGSPAHLGAELTLGAAGVTATHVPYKGATESTQAVVGRQVDFALAITSVALPHIRSGKLVALATSAPKRHDKLPRVPTLAEAGVPVALVSIGGLSVPAGTPKPVIARIAGTLKAALDRPEVQARLDALGAGADWASADDYTAALRAEIGLTDRLMAAARLEAQ